MPYTLRGLGFEAHWPFDSGLEEKDSILNVQKFQIGGSGDRSSCKKNATCLRLRAAASQLPSPSGPRNGTFPSEYGSRAACRRSLKVVTGNKFIASNPTRAVADNRGSCSHIAVAVAVTAVCTEKMTFGIVFFDFGPP